MALRLVLVLAASGDERFDRAAARFAARLAVKRRLSLSQAQLALAALQTLNASDPGVGAEALSGLLERCGEVEAASCLDRWLVGRGD